MAAIQGGDDSAPRVAKKLRLTGAVGNAGLNIRDARFTAAGLCASGVTASNGTARIYDVTVSKGSLAGRWLIINDDTDAIATSDTFVSITGIAGALG